MDISLAGSVLSRRAYFGLLKSLIVMNLLDGIFTTIWLELNLATEANVLMRLAYNVHPVLFMLIKLFLVTSSASFLAIYIDKKISKICCLLFFFTYSMVLCYHLVGLMVSLQ